MGCANVWSFACKQQRSTWDFTRQLSPVCILEDLLAQHCPTGMPSCRRTQPKLRIHRWRKVGDDTLPSPLFTQNQPYCSGQGCCSSLLCLWQQPWEQQEQISLLCSLLHWQVYPYPPLEPDCSLQQSAVPAHPMQRVNSPYFLILKRFLLHGFVWSSPNPLKPSTSTASSGKELQI